MSRTAKPHSFENYSLTDRGRRHDVLDRIVRVLVAVMIVAALGAQQPPSGQAPKGPQWKDAAEFDLFQAFQKEQDPNKKLAILDQWKQKYPATELKAARQQLYIQIYQQLGKADKMVEVSKE